jgi:hypothetical protein
VPRRPQHRVWGGLLLEMVPSAAGVGLGGPFVPPSRSLSLSRISGPEISPSGELGNYGPTRALRSYDRRRCRAVPLLLDGAELKGSDADALPAASARANIVREFVTSAEAPK